jgi:hypothetical protein
MSQKEPSHPLVLSIFPSTKGFGYALFEGPKSLVDWGIKIARGARKNAQSLERTSDLLAFYRPDVLVLEEYEGRGSRRATRIEKLIVAMAAAAEKERIDIAFFSRGELRACFGLTAKREIAEAIARDFPELEPRLPPVRRIWMSEDARMNIFDAAAFGMTFFHTREKSKRAA